MKYHLTPVRMAIIKNLQTINAGEGGEKRESLYTITRYIIGTALWRIVWRLLKKLIIDLP